MGDFPALPSPATEGVEKLGIDAFLEALHGPPSTGPIGGLDLAHCEPRLVAVDVRSPAEFAIGHIPGAVNIPLFDDEARAEVGTTFVKKGRYEAIKLGLASSGQKFASFLEALEGHGVKPEGRVLVYCWRGGMRSGSMAWLFCLAGYKVNVLEGGYRSYRRWCKTIVGNPTAIAPAPVMVLAGCTGVGKTAILHELRARGEQILDLEGLANHRGSAFGSMGQAPQPSNEAYENLLAFATRKVDPSRNLWIEHESAHVGKVNVPFGIAVWVQSAPGGGAMVRLNMSQKLRVDRLVEDYCSEANVQTDGWVAHLKECISVGLAKRLGGLKVKQSLQMLDDGQWSEVAAMMLDYYDGLYTRWADQSTCDRVFKVDCPTADASDNASHVLRAIAGEAETPPPALDRKRPGIAGSESTRASEASSSTAGVAGEEKPQDGGQRLEGSCHCGEVKVICTGEPRAVSYCHCSICRRLSGAPFSCQAVFAGEQVELTLQPGAGLTSLQTSKGVERSRCANCQAPVRGTLLGGRMAAVPLGLLTTWRGGEKFAPPERGSDCTGDSSNSSPPIPCLPRPQHHIHYRDRVMDVRDGLPKFLAQAKGGKSGGAGDALPEAEW